MRSRCGPLGSFDSVLGEQSHSHGLTRRRSVRYCAGASAFPSPCPHRTCRCGRRLNILGHHRTACAREEGFVLEYAAPQVCRGGWCACGHQSLRAKPGFWAHSVQWSQVGGCRGGTTLWRGGVQLAIGNARVVHKDGSAKKKGSSSQRSCIGGRTSEEGAH